MRSKRIKVFAGVLAISLCLQVVSSVCTVNAAKTKGAATGYLPDSMAETFVAKTKEYMNDTEDAYNASELGQSGLLARLDCIQQYALVLYYLETYKDQLNISGVDTEDSILDMYSQRFFGLCAQFNATFNKKESASFEALNIDISEDNTKTDDKLKSNIETLCQKTVPEYLGKILKNTNDKIKEDSLTDDKVLSKYGMLLSTVVEVLDGASDMCDDLTSISPYESDEDLTNKIDFDSQIKISTATASLYKDYKDLLDIGESVATLVGSNAMISIDASKGFLSNLANVSESNGNVTIPDNVQLSQAYLAILAAGATYVPFQSYVGESSFISALESLVPDKTAVKPLTDLYNDTKNFRKPLYKRELSNKGTPAGKASLITINEFLDDIEKGTEGALVTIDGKFTYDTKNNYWVYADTYSTNQDDDNIEGAIDENDFSSVANEALDTAEVTEGEAEEALDEKQKQENENGGSNSNSTKIDKFVAATPDPTDHLVRSMNITVKSDQTCITYQFGFDEVRLDEIELRVVYTKSDGTILKYEDKNNNPKKFVCSPTRSYKSLVQKAETKLKIPDKFKLSKIKDLEPFLKYGTANTKVETNKTDSKGKKIKVKLPICLYTEVYEHFSGNDLDNGITDAIFQKNSAKSSAKLFNRSNLFSLTVNAASVTDGETTNSENTSSSGESNSEVSNETNSETSNETNNETSNETSSETSSEASTESTSGGVAPIEETTEVSQTIQTSISTNEVSGMSVSATDVPGIMADKVITGEDKISEPILLYGAKHARGTDNLTTLLLRNIIAGTVGIKEMYNESNDYLYVNAYGDIVTDDGMVILPGIANPIMYGSSEKYNPYTAAFMNYYPTILENTSFFQVASENDIGKMIIMNDTADSLKNGDVDPESAINNKATSITSICDVKPTAPISIPEFETTFYYNNIEEEKILDYARLVFGDAATWTEDGKGMYAYTPLVIKSQMSSGGVPVFPYNVDDDRDIKSEDSGATSESQESYSCANIIASNMFHYLTTDFTGKNANIQRLNDNYIVYYYCISNLNGTSNPLAYANADTYSYDRYVDDTEVRKEDTLLQVSNNILNSLGDSQQVIGIKQSAQDPILGNVFAFIKAHWVMFFFLLVVILLFGFARASRDAFQSIILMLFCVVMAYGFVYIVPNYLPLAFNSVINNVSENLAYEIFGVKIESNDIEKIDPTEVDSNGNYTNKTSSLTLYRVGSGKLKDFYNGFGISESDVVGGKTYMINQESGLFIEGDCLKINTDVLMKTLEITGSYSSETANYKLDSAKVVSNNMDYYTPYYQFVDNFIGKLNDLASIYAIPRSMTKYSDDILKDNYLVYSYTNSLPFLTPGIYDSYDPAEQGIEDEEQLQYLIDNQKEIAQQLETTFGNEETAKDWLGISDFFYNLDPEYQNTIWAQTMYTNGYYYYDSDTATDWVPDEDKINDLCNYINNQTKKFVFKMEDQIGVLSDDVMIKIITLRELTAFTQYVSDMGHWLYPFSLNYAEMSLRDVLSCVLVDDYYSFVSCDMNICDYVLQKYGWFHLILFDALVILLFIISTVVQYAVPLMYLLLGALLIIKLVTNANIKAPLLGYIKCTLLTMLCSTLVCAGIVLTDKFKSSVISIYFIIALLILVATILLTIVTSLITNIADFGNTKLNAKAEDMKNSMNTFKHSVTTANLVTNVMQNRKGPSKPVVTNDDLALRYSNSRSVDDFYDDMHTGYETIPQPGDADSNVSFDFYDNPVVSRSSTADFSDIEVQEQQNPNVFNTENESETFR